MISCLERAHVCLGGRSRGAWAAPLGSWAPPRSSQGGFPAPNYKGQSRPSTLQIRIKICVDADIDFWSIWARSWAPLGGHVRSCWRLFRPKLVSEPSLNRLIFESDLSRNITFSNSFCPKLTPGWSQDRPKIAPRWVQDRLG